MVEGDQGAAVGILDRLELKAGTAVQLAAIGHGVLDRRELQKVVLALTRSGEQQQHEPNGLQRVSPLAASVVGRRKPQDVNLSPIDLARNGRRSAGLKTVAPLHQSDAPVAPFPPSALNAIATVRIGGGTGIGGQSQCGSSEGGWGSLEFF